MTRRQQNRTSHAFDTWCDVATAEDVWELAADFKRDHGVALGDVFTLTTAEIHEATAYTGGDDDFDDVNVPVNRFREEGAG